MQTFHHIGIPTQTARANETYMEPAGLYITDSAADPYRIEWLRFDDDSPLPELLKTTAHVAYEVDDLPAALEGQQLLIPPFSPVPGLTVAFITHDGAPVELMKLG